MRRGFSLVELSIVLVLLGLLTGGILAGQSLIRASELRGVVGEYQRYQSAIQTFRDTYTAAPGDMKNATAYWGRTSTAVSCVTNSSAAVAAPGTCDGNGDESLNNISSGASTSQESFQLWNHLALAGLIEGSYSGFVGSGSTVEGIIGTNIPGSRITNGAWFAWNWLANGGSASLFYQGANYYNGLAIGGSNRPTWPSAALFKPEEAWNIDTKLDDGKPGAGRIIAMYWDNSSGTGCGDGTTNTNLAANYNIAYNAPACVLIFTRIF